MRRLVIVVGSLCLALGSSSGRAQLTVDAGAAAAWHKLRKLTTTATVMHTTAHPDDEHGGVLAMLSRRDGAAVSLLTLTRGESGDNAIGSELFDALGLIRTEELLAADRYYGVDRQYFGTVVDYGYSKRLDEALEKWGKQYVVGEVVRAIRLERPFVVISRFQGNERDGHGNHSAAGLVTREAFDAAADPGAFPEHLAAGLQPWRPLKLYMGGVRANEDWTIRLDTGEHDPVLGEPYQVLARTGLSFQRSQNGGRVSRQPGPSFSYYKRLASVVDAPARETAIFDGIDTTIAGIYRALRETPPPAADGLLQAVEQHVNAAIAAFRIENPSAAAPALAQALGAVRTAMTQLGANGNVRFVLAAKERQIADALVAVLGITLTGTAQPSGTPDRTDGFGAAPPAMPPVVPGQKFDVRTTFVNPGALAAGNLRVDVESSEKWGIEGRRGPVEAPRNQPVVATFAVTVPDDAVPARPNFFRASLQESRYTIRDDSQRYRPAARPPLEVVARCDVQGVPLEIRRPVTRFEANVPYGVDTRELTVVPAIAVTLSPSHVVAPIDAAGAGSAKTIRLSTEILHNRDGVSEGTVTLNLPPGWKATVPSQAFRFSRAGERALYRFDVAVPALENRDYRVEAVASSGGRTYREGYRTIRHRDLETRYLYREASATVRGVDVRIAPGLRVGYVMGIGDDVPAGLAQLGVDVELLDQQALATGDLKRFNAIMTGTRAYAVREDLKTYNRRLLDYVRDGGNLIVLYNTQELVPALYSPYPAELPASAEEVSEEDSPVDILAPDAPVLNAPNRISKGDFEHWIEQRGSKYWTAWDPRYTALIATWDKGQPPQKGGWLHARYGKGHYTYFAYALHRQLPYGVPGAYRLLANLLSMKSD